jgi:hypothetical protein
MNQLPDKPSELIRVALADLGKCETDTAYEIAMGTWHTPTSRGACAVCLVGSVMAKTLGADPDEVAEPFDLGHFECRKLEALDDFRTGDIERALRLLELPPAPESVGLYREITHYEDDPGAFKSDMRQLADDLERAGL